jgi:hypothetical protein
MFNKTIEAGPIRKGLEPDCGEAERMSPEETRAIEEISDRIVAVMRGILEKPFVGQILRPLARQAIDGFHVQMNLRGLGERHLGEIARNTIRGLDEYLNADKN